MTVRLGMRTALALALVAVVIQPAEGWQQASAANNQLGLRVAANAPAGQPPQAERHVIVRVRPGGFDWGDAAIGGAGAMGLTLLVRGLALGAKRKGRLFGGGHE